MTDQARCREDCSCSLDQSNPTRRDFLQTVVAVASLPAAQTGQAAPAAASSFEALIPVDKGLSSEWLRSLVARGEPAVYRGADLDKIGMPVGGICTGTVYLGGDGRLWHWDIFNRLYNAGAAGVNYAKPLVPSSPFEQGFVLRIDGDEGQSVRRLDRSGWADIAFRGEYPFGFIEYRDPACPLAVSLEAFSPFIPLNAKDSAFPATIMRFTVRNTSSARVEATLGGWLENAAGLHSAATGTAARHNEVKRSAGCLILECGLKPATGEAREPLPDILFDDFERPLYDGWAAEGTAFGSGPISRNDLPKYQGDVVGEGERVVNSHNARQGKSVRESDSFTGRLTSRMFAIERGWITFWIGGGGHEDKTCLNLLVDGKVVASATGDFNNRMRQDQFDVRAYRGRTGRLEIVDETTGSWGNIGVDHIVFSDQPLAGNNAQADSGTMALALLGSEARDRARAVMSPVGEKLIGNLNRTVSLDPGEEKTVTFVVAWFFPNLTLKEVAPHDGRMYGHWFTSATDVCEQIAGRFEQLYRNTRLWHDTWYDATLPRWLLDRTFANTSILASSTCYWLGNDRFYGFEGIGCCPGTCTHVWHYAQAVARLFPELERRTREMVDFGIAMAKDGSIGFRGEIHANPAADGQAGCVLRAYREHQMTADDSFLRTNWPHIRRALDYLIGQDGNNDGILEGKQHNTLDTDWYGPVSWLSSLYLAALRAGEEMAREVGDAAYADRAGAIVRRGQRAIVEKCWNGEYFVHKADPAQPVGGEKNSHVMKAGNGCEIDQVFGQHWAFQLGLGRLLDRDKVAAALRAIWKYNFTADVGPFRLANPAGRWYAMPGEGGTIMCTFPYGEDGLPPGIKPPWAIGYFNECMSGFEYQFAGHLIWEGMLTEGLAVARMIHDRYHPSRRNPWNEIECSDHYARAMASYGVFLAVCGYDYHGPRGHLRMAPQLGADDFRAAFTAAEGWGTFSQRRRGTAQHNAIHVKRGRLTLRLLTLEAAAEPAAVEVRYRNNLVAAKPTFEDGELRLSFSEAVVVQEGESLEVAIDIGEPHWLPQQAKQPTAANR